VGFSVVIMNCEDSNSEFRIKKTGISRHGRCQNLPIPDFLILNSAF